jgi:predicted AAA+ superfamily ATPase
MIDLHRLKPRLQTPLVSELLAQHPVVVLHGARQTGKTTLAQVPAIGQGRSYLTLDDFDVRETAQRDPAALFAGRTCFWPSRLMSTVAATRVASC